MQVVVANVLTISDPTPELLKWCKDNLILANPDYAKKQRMGFWVGNTPRTISLFEINGNQLVLPFGVLKSVPREIWKEAEFIADFAEAEEVDFNAIVPLYDYQEEAVQAMIKAKYGILQSPAGSGKTQMGIALATRLKRKTLWLCHTLDLVRQSKERAELYMSKDLIGMITEGKVNIGSGITFATVQTMSKLDLARYRNEWDCIITDEVHRVSGTPTAVTQYQRVLNNLSARHKYGLSATVHRSDGMIAATYALVGEIAYKVPDEAVADKIMRVGICPVGTGVVQSRAMLNTDGTLNYAKMISYLTTCDERQQIIVDTLLENEGRSCLILSDRLEHLEDLINRLPTLVQMDAVMISGKMTSKKGKADREKAIEDMRTGKKKYLFATYSLAKEGLDIPRLERLFLTTPQKDYAVITQAIGRVARTFEGKDDPIAYDFVDNTMYLVKAYKKRCSTYKKNKCYFVED
jgi:superfamily II DNA or RNA helicase